MAARVGHHEMATVSSQPGVGPLLREWRKRRRRTQLDLALDAGISARHLSFVETGRSTPSAEMVLLLAEQLEVPFRGRNQLLLAAGHAPAFPERSLEDPQLAPVRDALDLILTQHEPYPALVIDRRWNIVAANSATVALAEWLDPALLEPPNTMQRIMSELAPRILNLGEVLSYFVERVAPLGVLESFAAGTAVVASDLGGMAELIEDGVAGLLVPPKDAAGLAAAMQALWNDPSRAYWMGERALQFAQVEMDLLGQAQRMLTLYRSITGAGRPQTGEEVADSARSQRARGSTFSKQ